MYRWNEDICFHTETNENEILFSLAPSRIKKINVLILTLFLLSWFLCFLLMCVCVCLFSEWHCKSCTMVNAASSILCEVCERPRLATRPPATPSHKPANPPRPPAPVLGMPGDPDSQVSSLCVCVRVCVWRSFRAVQWWKKGWSSRCYLTLGNEVLLAFSPEGAIGANSSASALDAIRFSGPLQHGLDCATILCVY